MPISSILETEIGAARVEHFVVEDDADFDGGRRDVVGHKHARPGGGETCWAGGGRARASKLHKAALGLILDRAQRPGPQNRTGRAFQDRDLRAGVDRRRIAVEIDDCDRRGRGIGTD